MKTTEKAIIKERIHDSIRGSLIAGAAGDALGYTVEFNSRASILAHYGDKGITKFALERNGKALISDDTQMTLFTANGMLMGITRGCMRGVGGRPEYYVPWAYKDWYYTQLDPEQRKSLNIEYYDTWLHTLPELAHRRAPGRTCLQACEAIIRREKVHNNSKGCGGIMRVAPLGLLLAGYAGRGSCPYTIPQMFVAGSKIAQATHLHPLGFLPAGMLTELVYHLALLSPAEAKEKIDSIAEGTIRTLEESFQGEYLKEKRYLSELTREAIRLAHSEVSDIEAIRRLGEGWVAEETWAIVLYCAIRHIDDIEAAIIASVNHDGDSDSTGSVCGQIMGAIYGYTYLRQRNIFCPEGHRLVDTLELHDLILTMADDLSTSCIISEYSPLDTPEKERWYRRYCLMKDE